MYQIKLHFFFLQVHLWPSVRSAIDGSLMNLK